MVDKTTAGEGPVVKTTRTPRKAVTRPAGPPASAAADDKPKATEKAAAKAAVKPKAAKKGAAKADDKPKATKKVAAKAAKADDKPKAAGKASTKAAKADDKPKAAKKTDGSPASPAPLFQAPDPAAAVLAKPRRGRAKAEEAADAAEAGDDAAAGRRRRRRGGRGRRGSGVDGTDETTDSPTDTDSDDADDREPGSSRRRRRRRRRGQDTGPEADDPERTVVRVREPRSRGSEDSAALKGSVRLEAKRQRRREGRDAGRRRAPILTEAEFLARRESVDRVMVVRQTGGRTQIAVLEDGVLVEHYVDRGSSSSMVGNVYLGRVQNVLPSMEAAFVDIGRGRNAVLYAGEVNWDAAGLDGQPRRIETALKSGDPVLVQVTKDPLGHKGARLTSQVSLPGRYLVYVPDGSTTGISRKLPDTERGRLKAILKKIVPEGAGVIVRTAAEGASEDELTRDITRLQAQWEDIEKKRASATPPALLSSEPDLAIKVIRDVFNEDFSKVIVSGPEVREEVKDYVGSIAPDLLERVEVWADPQDVFAAFRVDEQLTKALDRKVWLPSGGSLVIDRTEAMTVIDVNTGKFTGQGGNLEETVTKNNLEAAEEIVRQLRLRDVGGIIVVDFIDMVLESNRDLVVRRLVECLGRDRTKHQVAEITSLGLVQMTRKRIGQGLIEAFATPCESCGGRGHHVSLHPTAPEAPVRAGRRKGKGVDPADAVGASLALGAETENPESTGADEAPSEAS
ncbi:MAG: ribonuclease E/G [Actinobacteria bacterium]|nr:ribonuclease E/G [Actinomycetota bacterium]